MVINATVVCSRKWIKDNRTFNTITLSVIGLGSMDLTVDERLIPDLLDGQSISLNLGIGISKNKPYVKPDWESLKILNEEVDN